MGASTLQQILNYVTPGNFSFDSSLVEFTGSLARLKDLRPANALFHTKFETKDANWGNGVLTGTLGSNATVSGGVLNLPSGLPGRIDFAGTDNMPSGNTGCIRFSITPAYSGAPPGTWYFLSTSEAENNINSMIRMSHVGTNIRIDIYDSSGNNLLTGQTGNVFNPTAGTKYEIELNWNSTDAWLFVNGVPTGPEWGLTPGTQGARGLLRFGDNYLSSGVSAQQCTIDDITIFDTPQHTYNVAYTPFVSIPYQYSKDAPSIINASGVTGDAFDGLEDTDISEPAGSSLQYILNIAGQDMYWDGSEWSDSDGSFSQSNTLATLNANKASLDLSVGKTIKLKILLVSDDGSVRPEATALTLNYNFFNTQAQPATCTVWGFYRDASGIGVADATVTFKLKRTTGQYREASDAIIEKSKVVTTDANGRFEADLIRSSQYESGGTYELSIVKSDDSLSTSILSSSVSTIDFTVPDATDVNITDQITSVA